jgi:hypothetical protein
VRLVRVLKKLLKILALIIAGIFTLAVIAVIGARIYLSDERLARLVESKLNELFAGRFAVHEIHWSLPFHFVINDVTIDDPEGTRAIHASQVVATLRWRALLHGTLAIDDIDGPGIDVRVLAMQKHPELLGIAEAFTPKTPELPKPDVEDDGPPLTLSFHGSLIDSVEFVFDSDGTRVAVSGGHIENVFFGMTDNLLTVDAEPLPARRQHRHVGAARHDGLDESRRPVQHVLAVVDHQQQLADPQVVDDGLLDRQVRSLLDAQGRGHRMTDRAAVGQGGELAEPHSVGEP